MRRTLLLCALAIAAHARAAVPISFSGFVDGAFSWNRNHPGSHENFIPGTGTTGKRGNEVSLNLAQVQWSRAANDEQPVGFTLALVAGEGKEVVHSAEPKGGGKFQHIYQASMAYRLPGGVVLEAGIYPSHIGMEGFYSKDNWNYTRSWLGEFSPYYQTGLKAAYSPNDRWSGQVHVLNGWQVIHGKGHGKAIGTQVAFTSPALAASFNTYVDGNRRFGDVVAIYRAAPSLQLAAAFDVGSQDDVSWIGAAAYARYAIDGRHAVAVRAELFRDADRGITGTAQTLRELTLTYEFRPHKSLILKAEGRCDRSSEPVFADARHSQLLLILGAVVIF